MKSQSIKHLDPSALARAAGSLKAIAHPMRLAIIDLLRKDNSLTVTEIYETLGLEQAVASQHLGLLRDNNILIAKRKGKHTLYSLSNNRIINIIQLMMDSSVYVEDEMLETSAHHTFA
jgi:DNA-binding transcriptional ArsR family regulator